MIGPQISYWKNEFHILLLHVVRTVNTLECPMYQSLAYIYRLGE